MTAECQHGGTTSEERLVPLSLIGQAVGGKKVCEQEVSQLLIAPTVCKLLNIPKSEYMAQETLFDIKE